MATKKKEPTEDFLREIEAAVKPKSLNERKDAVLELFLRETGISDTSAGNRELARGVMIDLLDRTHVKKHKLKDGRGIEKREQKPRLSSDPKEREQQIRKFKVYSKRLPVDAPRPIVSRPTTETLINPDFIQYADKHPNAKRRLRQIAPPVVSLCRIGEECDVDGE